MRKHKCPGDHQHGVTEGTYTKASGRHTENMAKAVHRAWAKEANACGDAALTALDDEFFVTCGGCNEHPAMPVKTIGHREHRPNIEQSPQQEVIAAMVARSVSKAEIKEHQGARDAMWAVYNKLQTADNMGSNVRPRMG